MPVAQAQTAAWLPVAQAQGAAAQLQVSTLQVEVAAAPKGQPRFCTECGAPVVSAHVKFCARWVS